MLHTIIKYMHLLHGPSDWWMFTVHCWCLGESSKFFGFIYEELRMNWCIMRIFVCIYIFFLNFTGGGERCTVSACAAVDFIRKMETEKKIDEMLLTFFPFGKYTFFNRLDILSLRLTTNNELSTSNKTIPYYLFQRKISDSIVCYGANFNETRETKKVPKKKTEQKKMNQTTPNEEGKREKKNLF